MELETERLIIRPTSENDKEELFKYRSDREIKKDHERRREAATELMNTLKGNDKQEDVVE